MSLSKSVRICCLAFSLALMLVWSISLHGIAQTPPAAGVVQETKADPNQGGFNALTGATATAPLMSSEQRNELYGKFALIVVVALGAVIALFAWKVAKPSTAVTMEEAHSAYDGPPPKLAACESPGSVVGASVTDTADGTIGEEKNSAPNQSS